MNELVGIIKDHLAGALLENAQKWVEAAKAIVGLAERYVVPDKPGRSTPRSAPRCASSATTKKQTAENAWRQNGNSIAN
ncbi:MAG: hypothetical protein FWG10_12420 [Eubacteriaceae bacterium]|nr:hypothetical protein [Eubacteriaceae bacterium]